MEVKKMESWKSSLLAGIFFLIIAIALTIANGKITIGTIAPLILFIIGVANAIRLKPKN